jgi:hypothetical protein
MQSAMKHDVRKSLSAASAATLAAATVAAAQDRPAPPQPMRPVVVEMFLSQACRMSPAAAEALNELAGQPGLITLAWHVDYYNAMAAEDVGPWADPFSQAAYSDRQRLYNEQIRGRRTVFTPQAIINGAVSVSGARREAIERGISASFAAANAPAPSLAISRLVEAQDTTHRERFRAAIDNVTGPYDAVLVTFAPRAVTVVSGGDNAGVTFRETNVVTKVSRMAVNGDGPVDADFNAPPKGYSCAVLVQEKNRGRILAAQYCPQD